MPNSNKLDRTYLKPGDLKLVAEQAGVSHTFARLVATNPKESARVARFITALNDQRRKEEQDSIDGMLEDIRENAKPTNAG